MSEIAPLTDNAPIYLSGLRKNSYSYEQLIECSQGKLFGPGNAQLPSPPMLMFDRITEIHEEGGEHGRGYMTAELDIDPSLWFFQCHFEGDPVMPGCLGLDAMWQLVGFFIAWRGGLGHGRALGGKEIDFTGQVTPDKKLVRYHINIKRLINRKLVMGIADAEMEVDGETIYVGKNLRVGLFTDV